MPPVPARLTLPLTAAPLPVKRVVATVLFTDAAGRVLVVEPTYKPRWELPGGAVEDGESPWTAAAREVVEELGVDRSPGRLLVMDYVPAAGDRSEGIAAAFDGGVLPTSVQLRLPPDELSRYAFVEPELLGFYLPELLTRRAIAALTARASGETAYLENGYSVLTR